MILAIHTGTAQLELILYRPDGGKLDVVSKELGRAMAENMLDEIEALLKSQDLGWSDLSGIVVFKGPGSFTGLRIGVTVANTIAYAQKIPIVGTVGGNWAQDGAEKIADGQNERQVLPEYGAPANISKPRR